MSQPMSFPRPRMCPDDAFIRSTPDELPKRVPGAALHGVPGARNSGRAEQPRLDWRPYPPRRRGRLTRLMAAVRGRLHRR